jgi:putative oxidoreductase
MNARLRGRLSDPEHLSDVGRLLLRLGFGITLAAAHGWGKLSSFAERSSSFADPYGIGPTASLALAILAELGCGLLVAVGLFTRLATIPPLFVMATAFFVVHAADPFGRKELALVYFVGLLAILLLGPGRYALDSRPWRRR